MILNVNGFLKDAEQYGCHRNHVIFLNKLLEKLEVWLTRQNLFELSDFKLIFTIVNHCLQISLQLESLIKINLKYVYKQRTVNGVNSPLLHDFHRLKVLIARFYTMQGDLKEKAKLANITMGQLERVKSEEDGMEVENINTSLYQMPQFMTKYLTKLSKEIERMTSPDKLRLSALEKGIFILKELVAENKLYGVHKEISNLEILRAIRLINLRMKC